MTTDPLAALRQPTTPIAPPPAFASDLRARVEAALTDPRPPSENDPPNPRSTTMTTTDPTTARTDLSTGSASIVPYLIVDGAADAIDFYRAAFGAEVTMRLDMPDGRVGHAELDILGAEIALADEYPEQSIVGPASLGGTSVTLRIVVPDVDAFVATAAAAGATVEREPADQFYGSRAGTLIDPFGHRWNVQTPIEDVSVDEMQRRLTALDDDA